MKADALANELPGSALSRTGAEKGRVAAERYGYLALIVQLDDQAVFFEVKADGRRLSDIVGVFTMQFQFRRSHQYKRRVMDISKI